MTDATFKSGYRVPELPDAKVFRSARIAIVATRWNVEVVDSLVDGARRCLADWGVPARNIREYRAPGAYELPLAVQAVLKDAKVHGAVALGTVIRGDTPHFDFVAGECARGLMDVQLKTGKPLGFGVLTVNTPEQAFERALPDGTNKGYEAAAAMLEMLRLLRGMK
ncbi:MAG TPA: 6,7-dimethyl-8-ribityllumazine synthase [Solimonas sp.]|nr:6,7-dimethyl-8-ribityllumazine synthase [Solimonas sp.]